MQCGVCSFNCPMGIDVRRHVWANEPVADARCRRRMREALPARAAAVRADRSRRAGAPGRGVLDGEPVRADRRRAERRGGRRGHPRRRPGRRDRPGQRGRARLLLPSGPRLLPGEGDSREVPVALLAGGAVGPGREAGDRPRGAPRPRRSHGPAGEGWGARLRPPAARHRGRAGRAPVPGADLDGVVKLDDLDDARDHHPPQRRAATERPWSSGEASPRSRSSRACGRTACTWTGLHAPGSATGATCSSETELRAVEHELRADGVAHPGLHPELARIVVATAG